MKSRLLVLIVFLMLFSTVAAQDADALPYQNPDLSIEDRVEDLLSWMTLEEKFGQMTLIEKNSITPEDLSSYHVGAVLSGGGGYPTGDNTPSGWLEMVHSYQDAALNTRLGIPMLYGVDAIHGHNNLAGAVIFPHNVGLGAANNPELVQEIGRITATEMIATGIYWNYAPVLAVPQDIRWGRAYEGYSEDPAIVNELATAMLIGMQGDDLADPLTVLGTPKHFVGDGGTAYETSPIDGALLDRGVTDIDEETLRDIHLLPYYDAIANGARSIMISYSSWGGEQMHAQAYLIQDVLREEMGFDGFIVSDWGGIDVVAPTYYESVVQSVNAGIDMNMVPYDYVTFISALDEAVENGDITLERIDEAVSNILRVKFELGLFETPYGDPNLQALIGSDEHRAVARQAVSESLVLLKNENDALPLDPNAEQTVFITGQAGHNIGIQSGGWTIEWQGISANVTPGTTIREGLEDAFGDDVSVRYSRIGRFNDDDGNPARADIGIVVVGEEPYAEWFGDDADLLLSSRDSSLIERMREQVDTLVVVLIAGRPMVIDQQLNLADAFVAAWLPGTEGGGVADVLVGDQDFVGTLPFTWLRSTEQLPYNFDSIRMDGCEAPLFPRGYGLTYESATEDASEWLDLSVECAAPTAENGDTAVVGNLLEDGAGRDWELIWSDEFDGDAIDSTRWSYDTGGNGFGNNELQYYSDREENSYVEDGNLVIVAQEEQFITRDYTSAKLWTLGHFSMQYGRIDIRARLPQGQGMWPAFWMLPTRYAYGGWPASGEIDIMELIGHEPATVHGTLHYTGSELGTHVYTGDSLTLEDGTFADDFHVFSIVWEEDRFEWYIDGELYQVQTEWQTAGQDYPAPFDQEFFLIINLAVGGEWPGSPDETTEFPQTLEVDYVRVYQVPN